jgi:hypothetical protein
MFFHWIEPFQLASGITRESQYFARLLRKKNATE